MDFKNYFISKNPTQTKKIAEILAKKILKKKTKKAKVLGLVGDLGGGKTTFLQGFAKGLGIKEKILSPTFVILKKFQIPPKKIVHCSFSVAHWFYHIDCYRIKKPKEILDLGFKEIIQDPKNIVAIEWAERLKEILPKKTIWIRFEFINKNIRKIQINNF
jgi:tRNA threonylcarbamoyladenosine biosynthesis protein TsaE